MDAKGIEEHEKTKCLEGVGSNQAHVTGHIAHVKPIKERQDKAVENGQDSGSLPFAHVTGILSQGDVSSVMKFVLDGPVLPDEFKEALRTGLDGSEAGETVDVLLGPFEPMVEPATQEDDLTNGWPVSAQKVIEFGRGDQEALFDTTMTSIQRLGLTPIVAIHRRFAEKELEILFQGGLIAFRHEDILSS